MIRLYTPQILCLHARIVLEAQQWHYLVHVMRKVPGQEIMLFNGKDGLWKAILEKKEAIVTDFLSPQPSLTPDMAVFFSPIKRQNWLLEKATELGATHFFPIHCARSVVKKFSHSRHLSIIIQACEQSERLFIPHLAPLQSLAQALSTLSQGPYVALDPLFEQHISACIPAKGFFIGPEGGWTDTERMTFKSHPLVSCAFMGRFVLRAETAALTAVSSMTLLS